jgi:transposase
MTIRGEGVENAGSGLQTVFDVQLHFGRTPGTEGSSAAVIRAMADAALKELDQRFAGMYAAMGRPSIAPERLLRALLLQVLYTVRGEGLLMEQLDYNFLFGWFVGPSIDDPVWDVTVFTKNRNRLLKGEVAEGFSRRCWRKLASKCLLSDEHFTVDGTLIEAWAGHKSFRHRDGKTAETPPKDDDPGSPIMDFHGERRNDTHQSTTDPDARLARKGAGKEARLSYAGRVLMENRNGLAVNCCITKAAGRAEAEAAVAMVRADPGGRRITLGADKATTAQNWCGKCASIVLPRILPAGKPVPLMSVPHAILAMRSVSANGWRRSSAGLKPSAGCERRAIAASPWSIGRSPWHWRP